ncbi:MAG TPA: hypothetical protein VKT77_05760 [Chthonomonadaceae bacterium]|nr:hypothetical protein [Chthonomonadaceae bacterium]
MILGGMMGLLAAVAYTIFTGRFTLTKTRIAYGMPARAAALLALVPVMLVCAYAIRLGGIANMPNGIAVFLCGLVASIAVGYAVAWPFGEPPRT